MGRQLARLLKRPFFDLDQQIELSQGMSIAQIFEAGGERRFRMMESGELSRLCKSLTTPTVIALGGGTLIVRQNRKVVRSRGTTVYLRCSQLVLLQRLATARNRPLLQTGINTQDRRAAIIRQLLAMRRKTYESCDITISVSKLTPLQAARRIRETIA